MQYDVVIVGAGVTGCAIARELSRYDLQVLVLEKEEDVCTGTSKANSGICHAGYDAKPGSLKARLNVRGNALMEKLAQDLDFAFQRNGSLVLAMDKSGLAALEELRKQGAANGVEGLEIWEKETILAHEPHVSNQVEYALWAPSAGIVDPFGLTFALAENAADNGVEFRFLTPVETLEKTETGWRINDAIEARMVINAAGVYADIIHNLVFPENPIHITPRKGEYYLFDHAAGSLCSATLFPLPTALGKGILTAPTAHGNLLAGPTAHNQEDKEEVATTAKGLEFIKASVQKTLPHLPWDQVITTFAGLRAVSPTGDFMIKDYGQGFVDAAAIESPGLSSAPAIGEMVTEMAVEYLQPALKEHFQSRRQGFGPVHALDAQAWNAKIAQDPAYGHIVCRCETITEGEIRDAATRSVPAVSLDGVKRRVRAGMGRCQGGFCSVKTMEILAEIQQKSLDEVKKASGQSYLLKGRTKQGGLYEKRS